MGGFSSLNSGSSKGTGDALLVSVEGNTYLSVPILGFGAENDEVDNAEERMPWLSAEHPFGDTSPVTRFVMGLDEALRNYRGSEEALPSRNFGSSRDPWNEDLFYRHLPVPTQVPSPETDEPGVGGDPNARRPDPREDDQAAHSRFGDKPFAEPDVPFSSPAALIAAGLKAVAGLLAAFVLLPPISRYVHRETDPSDPVPAQR